MTDIYLVITEDRHASTEVAPFIGQDDAIAHAEQEVADNATHPELADEWERELNDAMIADRWIWYCRYGIEGCNVRVIIRELRPSSRAAT